MSERKGHGNRGSLMDLAKPRLAQSPLSAPIDEAERLILARQPETVTPRATVEPAEPQPTRDHSLEASQPETELLPQQLAPKPIPSARVQPRASRRTEQP